MGTGMISLLIGAIVIGAVLLMAGLLSHSVEQREEEHEASKSDRSPPED